MAKAVRKFTPHRDRQSRGNGVTAKWRAAQKFEAQKIHFPKLLASRDEWLRYAADIYPIVRLALLTLTKDDDETTDIWPEEFGAMIEDLEAMRDALAKYRQLTDLLNRAQARMLVGMERAAAS